MKAVCFAGVAGLGVSLLAAAKTVFFIPSSDAMTGAPRQIAYEAAAAAESQEQRERAAMAMIKKGVTLDALNRSQEAIAVYDEVIRRYGEAAEPGLREAVSRAMANKGARRR